MTQKFSSGVIHQKLRLERAQHAGYLQCTCGPTPVLNLVRGVFMHFLMDPDKTLQRYVLYRYVYGRTANLYAKFITVALIKSASRQKVFVSRP